MKRTSAELIYREGDWFGVPLPSGGYAVGLVARGNAKKGVLFGYFFGPKRYAIPEVNDIRQYLVRDAVFIGKFSDLHLVNRLWPLIGRIEGWARENWPMPHFARIDKEQGVAWEEVYSEDDPNIFLGERQCLPDDVKNLPSSGLMGADAVSLRLDRVVKGP
jgi:hypothetical protein